MEINQFRVSSAKPAELRHLGRYQCKVCCAHASGFHFGAQSCSACCAFFRRTVSLNRCYKCVKRTLLSGPIVECDIHYTYPAICKACRYRKCLEVGMLKDAVKSVRTENSDPMNKSKPKRLYWTKSGLKRNKYFAAAGISAIIKKNGNTSSSITLIENYSNLVETNLSTSEVPSPLSLALREDLNVDLIDEQSFLEQNASEMASSSKIPKVCLIFPSDNILRVLVQEEMRIAERRRILFCERPVVTLVGQNTECPFTAADIRPLLFQDFRKSIRTHILLVYEWLRVWPSFVTLSIEDQITLLRKSFLYHTILDPCHITYQMGDATKLFVLQNGGFVSVSDTSDEGWEGENEISHETKKKIYQPLLAPLGEIVAQMRRLCLKYEEFVALKTLVSFQMVPDISQSCRILLRKEIDALCRSLFELIKQDDSEDSDDQLAVAVRFGEIILLQTAIFDTANLFVESHHQVQFFGLWTLDSLMLQFLKNKPY